MSMKSVGRYFLFVLLCNVGYANEFTVRLCPQLCENGIWDGEGRSLGR